MCIRDSYCVERYLGRNALSEEEMANVLSAARKGPAQQAKPAKSGRATYDEGCRHCHEQGPAGPLLTRPFSIGPLRERIRGTNRAAHPDSLMPAFSALRLPDVALDALVEVMVAPHAGDHLDDQ